MLEQVTLKGTISARGCLSGSIKSRSRLAGTVRPKGVLTGGISTRGQMVGHLSAKGVLTGTVTPRGQLVGFLAAANTGEDPCETYMLVYEDGTEVPAVFVENETVFTATANDIRAGTVAATGDGVTVGTKEIPAYYTQEGWVKIPAGSTVRVNMYTDRCRYTKLQAVLCAFNGSINESVSTEKVSIDSKVYNVASAEIVAEVTVDIEQQAIDFGIMNTNEYPIVVRYFTFTEEQ